MTRTLPAYPLHSDRTSGVRWPHHHASYQLTYSFSAPFAPRLLAIYHLPSCCPTQPTSSSPPSPSPTVPAERLRFSFCLLPILCAWVSALDHSPLPIVLAARGSSACEPRLTPYTTAPRPETNQAF